MVYVDRSIPDTELPSELQRIQSELKAKADAIAAEGPRDLAMRRLRLIERLTAEGRLREAHHAASLLRRAIHDAHRRHGKRHPGALHIHVPGHAAMDVHLHLHEVHADEPNPAHGARLARARELARRSPRARFGLHVLSRELEEATRHGDRDRIARADTELRRGIRLAESAESGKIDANRAYARLDAIASDRLGFGYDRLDVSAAAARALEAREAS